jgi:hypothetical protein
MEIDITTKRKWKSNRHGTLSKKEKERRREKKLCFTYGLPGYMAASYKQVNITQEILGRKERIYATMRGGPPDLSDDAETLEFRRYPRRRGRENKP